jgi:hypothetical protein
VYAIAAALRSTNSALPSSIRLDDISNFETLLSQDEQREHAWNAIVAAVNTTSNTITTTSSEIPQWLQLKRTKDVTWIDQPLLTACQLFHNFHSSHPVELYKQKAFCGNYDCENRFDAALERLWPQSANDDHSNEDGDNDAGNEDSGFLSMAPIAAPIALVKTIVGTTASVTKTVAGTMLSTIVPLPFGAEDADPSIIDQATQSKANAASAAAAAVALRGRYTFLDPLDDVLFSADHHHATVSVEDDNADPAVVLAKLRKQLQVKEDTAQSQAQQAALTRPSSNSQTLDKDWELWPRFSPLRQRWSPWAWWVPLAVNRLPLILPHRPSRQRSAPITMSPAPLWMSLKPTLGMKRTEILVSMKCCSN